MEKAIEALKGLEGCGGSQSSTPSSKKKDDKWNELAKILQDIPPTKDGNIDELVLKLYAIYKSDSNKIADIYTKLTTLIMVDTNSTDFNMTSENTFCRILVRGTTRKNQRRHR